MLSCCSQNGIMVGPGWRPLCSYGGHPHAPGDPGSHDRPKTVHEPCGWLVKSSGGSHDVLMVRPELVIARRFYNRSSVSLA